MKTQTVRLFDVFLYGPFLIYTAGLQKDRIAKVGLFALGVGTIIYNGRNYLRQNAIIKEEKTV